jgi:cobalt-zinc-cadmium efflux system membrane fusion protein
MEKVKKGQKVIFTLAGKTDEIYEGSIFAVGKSFENQPKAMMVHAEIDNKTGHLLPGMYVDARIVTDTKKAKALPNEAIVSDGGLNYIFVLKPGSSEEEHEHKQEKEYVFRKIEVNTGASDIGYTEAIPVYNLPEHIQIVSKGAFYLLAEMKKGEGGHGHHH